MDGRTAKFDRGMAMRTFLMTQKTFLDQSVHLAKCAIHSPRRERALAAEPDDTADSDDDWSDNKPKKPRTMFDPRLGCKVIQ